MDPKLNPFVPGAGTQPPELAGRDSIINDAEVALARSRAGRAAKSQMLLGLRGVGKTVLLNRIAELAEREEFETVVLEAPENRSLASMLVPPLRSALFHLSGVEKARTLARRALGVLQSFARMFKVSVGDVEFGVELAKGSADSGDIEHDLPEVLQAVALAGREAGRGLALFLDEIQYLTSEDFAALIVATHKMGQKGLPFLLFGAGLPMVAALAGDAKSYAERLFDYPEVGALDVDAARNAIREPVRRAGVEISAEALQRIVERTRGYPYFLQEWAYSSWNTAPKSPIQEEDVDRGAAHAQKRLDAGFFRVRLDRLTNREKEYLRAMAELGGGPHRSGEIAAALGVEVSDVAPTRDKLIKKGMVYSPQHGDTAFTVPMFDEFLRRAMPEWNTGSFPAPRKKRSVKKRKKK
jgi:hypothetical protein